MTSELCLNCFSVKGKYDVCPYCGYAEHTPPRQAHYLTPGMVLYNQYIVGTAVGDGGFGITYKCYDTILGVIVAVKEFYPAGLVNRAPGEKRVGVLSGEKEAEYDIQLKHFLMEAKSTAQFEKAKDIVNVYNYFEENNTAYIVMEFIEGVLLKEYIADRGRMEQDTALAVIMPVIEAVKKIHASGILHRDLSPDNIFIAGDETIKVFDFGAAKFSEEDDSAPVAAVIKEGYAPPEQYRVNGKQGFFTDIYAVGAILYEMVTGIRPMEGSERLVKDELKSPRALGIQIDENLDRAIMEALAVKTELRFQSIQYFQEAVEGKRMAEYPEDKLKKRKRRRNWTIALSAAVVFVGAVLAGLFMTVLKPQNEMIDSVLTEDSIVVWVDSDEMKEKVDQIVENNFYSGTGTDEWGDNKNIQVICEAKAVPEYEQALAQARDAGVMPDLYMTDHISDPKAFPAKELNDTVVAALDEDDYYYVSGYERAFKRADQMPLGFDVLTYYAKKLPDGSQGAGWNTAVENRTIDFGDVLAAAEQEGSQETLKVGALAKALYLMDPSWFSEGKVSPNGQLVNNIERLAKLRQGVSGYTGEVNAVSYRGEVFGDVGAEENYEAAFVTKNGKILITFEDCFAVSSSSTKNKQTACERLLYVMLSTQPQQTIYQAYNGKHGIPLNMEAAEGINRETGEGENKGFYKFNPKFEALEKLIADRIECECIGDGIGEMKLFSEAIEERVMSSGTVTHDGISAFCQQYAEGQGSGSQEAEPGGAQ